jgi:hypothetical protein
MKTKLLLKLVLQLLPRVCFILNQNQEGKYDFVLENEDPKRNGSMDENFFLNYSKITEINK